MEQKGVSIDSAMAEILTSAKKKTKQVKKPITVEDMIQAYAQASHTSGISYTKRIQMYKKWSKNMRIKRSRS